MSTRATATGACVWKTSHLVSNNVVVLALPDEIPRALAFNSSVADVSTATASHLYPCVRGATTDWSKHYLHVLHVPFLKEKERLEHLVSCNKKEKKSNPVFPADVKPPFFFKALNKHFC